MTATETEIATAPVCNPLTVAVRCYVGIVVLRNALHGHQRENFDREVALGNIGVYVDVGGRRFIREGEFLHATITPGSALPTAAEVEVAHWTLVHSFSSTQVLQPGAYSHLHARAELVRTNGLTGSPEYRLTVTAPRFGELRLLYGDIMSQNATPETPYGKQNSTKADLEKAQARVRELEAAIGDLQRRYLAAEQERDNAVKAAAVWRAFAEACVRCNNSIRASGLFCGLVTSSWHIRDRKEYLRGFLEAVANHCAGFLQIPEPVAQEANNQLPFLDGSFDRS